MQIEMFEGCVEDSRLGAALDLCRDAVGGTGDASVATASQHWGLGSCIGSGQIARRCTLDLGALWCLGGLWDTLGVCMVSVFVSWCKKLGHSLMTS